MFQAAGGLISRWRQASHGLPVPAGQSRPHPLPPAGDHRYNPDGSGCTGTVSHHPVYLSIPQGDPQYCPTVPECTGVAAPGSRTLLSPPPPPPPAIARGGRALASPPTWRNGHGARLRRSGGAPAARPRAGGPRAAPARAAAPPPHLPGRASHRAARQAAEQPGGQLLVQRPWRARCGTAPGEILDCVPVAVRQKRSTVAQLSGVAALGRRLSALEDACAICLLHIMFGPMPYWCCHQVHASFTSWPSPKVLLSAGSGFTGPNCRQSRCGGHSRHVATHAVDKRASLPDFHSPGRRSNAMAPSVLKILWKRTLRRLASLPLAISELAAIAALCAIGTIIEQNQSFDYYTAVSQLSHQLSPGQLQHQVVQCLQVADLLLALVLLMSCHMPADIHCL